MNAIFIELVIVLTLILYYYINHLPFNLSDSNITLDIFITTKDSLNMDITLYFDYFVIIPDLRASLFGP